MEYHQYECGYLTYLKHWTVAEIGNLAFRSLLKTNIKKLKLEDGANDTELNFSDNNIIHSFLRHSESRNAIEDLLCKTLTAIGILMILVKAKKFFTSEKIDCPHESRKSLDVFKGFCGKCIHFIGGLILTNIQSIECNGHDITEYSTSGIVGNHHSIGHGVYPSLVMFNHSCEPNIMRRSYNGRTCVVRAIKPIKKDEELLDNYGYHYACTLKILRQQRLLDNYFFLCDCVACLGNWPTYHNSPKDIKYICRCSNLLDHGECSDCSTRAIERLRCSRDQNNRAEEALYEGLPEKALPVFLRNLLLLDLYTAKPNKEYYRCQENIRLVYSYLGNSYKEKYNEQYDVKDEESEEDF